MNEVEKDLIDRRFADNPSLSEEEVAEELLSYKNRDKYPYAFLDSEPISGPVFKNRRVTLTDREMIVCSQVGPKRTKASRAANRTNMIKAASGGSKEEKFIEINGLCGELCNAKLFNLYPKDQFEIVARSVKDDHGDCVIEGFVGDVKTTKYASGRLTLSTWKVGEEAEKLSFIEKIQFLILFTGNYERSPVFTYRGAFSSESMVTQKTGTLPGKSSPQYIVEQKNLQEIEEIFNALRSEVVV